MCCVHYRAQWPIVSVESRHTRGQATLKAIIQEEKYISIHLSPPPHLPSLEHFESLECACQPYLFGFPQYLQAFMPVFIRVSPSAVTSNPSLTWDKDGIPQLDKLLWSQTTRRLSAAEQQTVGREARLGLLRRRRGRQLWEHPKMVLPEDKQALQVKGSFMKQCRESREIVKWNGLINWN